MRKQGVILALCVLSCLSVASADYTSNMVAQWTFLDLNDLAPADATNDTLSLTPNSGSAELLTTGDNTSGVLKTASGGMANVTRSSELSFKSGDTFTIWARIKLGSTDIKCYELFRNETGSGGFTFRVNDSSGLPLRFRADSTASAALYIPDTNWHNVGVRVFMSGSTQKAEFYLDGASTGLNCDLFDDYGRDYDIGEPSGGATLYIEEMRIYNAFLSDTEMGEIEYVVPEPASLVLLAAGGLGLLVRRKR